MKRRIKVLRTKMYRQCPTLYCASSDVWVDEPTKNGVIIYSLITPVLALAGFIGNLLSLIIMALCRHYVNSTTTYLSVLALTHLAGSAFLLVAGLCRGVLWSLPGWRDYEAIIAIPFGGMFNCWASTAIVAVTIDRIVYLWCPTRTKPPAFCQQKTARIVMLGGLLVSILFNVPYCFMYTWDCNGNLATTEFTKTTFYTIHNWVKLILFSIIPALLLLLGNIYLVRSLKKMYKISEECRLRCNKASRSRDQKWVTVTLISMIFFFLIGEIPASLLSRSSVVTLLYWGDDAKADTSKALEFCRQIATLMNGLYLAMNFFIYYMFCSKFRQCVCDMLTCKICCSKPKKELEEKKPNKVQVCKNKIIVPVKATQVNVFIVDEVNTNKFWVPLAQLNATLIKLLE